LGGGGTTGDVTLRIKVPLSLVSSNTNPIITAENSGSGIGLSGKSASGYGVYGLSTNSYAGYFDGDVKVSGTGKGVEFPDGTKQTTASLGGDITGVIAGTGLSGGGTSGDVTLKVSVPLSLITSNTNPVITAENTSTGAGLYGKSASGYGVYSEGNLKVAGTGKGIEFPDGTKQTTAATATGDITGVTAGTGLSGGGTSGDVTLNVAVPFSLSGSSGFPIVSGTNSGGGQGLYGSSPGGIGVYGSSSTATGVAGTSTSWYGVSGSSTSGYGVYGSSASSYAGYFGGDIKISGTGKGIEFYDGTKQTTAAAGGDITAVNASTGLSGGGTSGDVTLSVAVPLSLSASNANPILKGTNTGSGPGVQGVSNTGYGVYGSSTSSYAGYFAGDVKVSGTGNGIEFPDGTTQTTATSGDITAVNAGIGLTGGGTAGAVTLTLANPLTLSGTTTAAIIKGDNNSSGPGVYGLSETGKGVSGESTSGYAVHGKSTSGYAGYFQGDVKVSGTGKGVEFPDGTKQTTAVEGGGGGIPSGFNIMGTSSTAPSGYTYTGWFIYSDGDGAWATKANMPTVRESPAAAAVNNKIYAIGGRNGSSILKTNEEYDPATNTWATKADMPTARWDLAAAAVNNKIYAIGGGDGTYVLKTNEEYGPATNTWATKADMPTDRGRLAAAVVNNKIYAIGGAIGYQILDTNEEYNPATNTWTAKVAMPTARNGLAAAAVNNKIYAIGGYLSDATTRGTNEEYNPATNTWETKTDMPTARNGLSAAAVNNKIYAIGGNYGETKNEEYNPSANAWATKTDMPTDRVSLAAAAVNNKIYVIGGWSYNLHLLVNKNEEYIPPPTFYIHQKD